MAPAVLSSSQRPGGGFGIRRESMPRGWILRARPYGQVEEYRFIPKQAGFKLKEVEMKKRSAAILGIVLTVLLLALSPAPAMGSPDESAREQAREIAQGKIVGAVDDF